ncbi:protein cornichon homolog 4 [Lingula anatina]|uniref:Protein cornichon homolog 4 n=1 Tax=Lingula anatina TaxID=7574 RepID=A0A1S3JIX4_LINAN|nr:protein cornichon homolog 4 [Lingula anatina]|eukprot:XP_013409854.1 protein cornichon homolog 4 [Lingula anatina]
MSVDSLLFIFALLDGACLLFLTVYFVITLSDLECDYLNATTCCNRLNMWVFPELAAHTILTFFFLITFNWGVFLLNTPLAGWQIYKYLKKPAGNVGIFDPAEIHNRHQLRSHMKEAMIKLAVHLIFFFIYLYCMILALLS